MSELEDIRKMLAQERAARKEAERNLEEKTRMLDKSNEKLLNLSSLLPHSAGPDNKESQEADLQLKVPFDHHLIPLMVYRLSDFQFVAVNQTAITRYGYTQEEFVQMKVADLHPKPELNRLAGHLDTASEKENWVTEWKHISKSGEIFDIEVSATTIEYKGHASRLVLISDITERSIAEKEREKSEKKYRTLVENVSDLIYQCNSEGEFTYVNPATEKVCGYPASELVGMHFLEFVKDSYREEVLAYYLWQLGDKVESTYLEFPMVDQSGKALWIGQTVNLHRIDDNNIEIIAHGRNITKQKEVSQVIVRSEERYRSIMENMELGLLMVDKNDVIINAFPKFCEMTGYAKEELIGKKVIDTLLPHEFTSVMEFQNQKRIEGEPGVYELKIKCKDGTTKWVIISGAPYYDEADNLEGSLGIHLDITDRKEMESELVAAKDIAEKSNQAKQIFMANMSHEIRTPMNAVIGMGKLLQMSTLNAKQGEYVDAILTSANNLLIIINDILDFSKIESGKLELENVPVNLVELLQNVQKTIDLKAEEKGLVLQSKWENIKGGYRCDPTRLYQVLLNLISNGVKFTDYGSVEMSCEVVSSGDGRDTLQFSVTDTGIGIAEEQLGQIFQTFSQAEKSTARKYGGTGLGLSISRQLVQMMGGELQVRSWLGKGARFFFTIELERCEEPRKEEESEENDQADLTGIKVLLVEDHEINRFVAQTILEQWSCDVDVAVNGVEAVEKVREGAYDIILMDMRMPEMDGLTASGIIRHQLKLDVPIIALTANAIKGDSQRCIEAGMNDYVSKPFSREELQSKMIRLIDKSAVQAPKKDSSIVWKDLTKLMEIVNGDMAFFKKMIRLFVDDTPELIEQIKCGLEEGDYETIGSVAHRLKPSLDHIANSALQKMVRQVENIDLKKNDAIAFTGRFCSRITLLLEQLKEEL
jgi:PAS domain S-box-containing protein